MKFTKHWPEGTKRQPWVLLTKRLTGINFFGTEMRAKEAEQGYLALQMTQNDGSMYILTLANVNGCN